MGRRNVSSCQLIRTRPNAHAGSNHGEGQGRSFLPFVCPKHRRWRRMLCCHFYSLAHLFADFKPQELINLRLISKIIGTICKNTYFGIYSMYTNNVIRRITNYAIANCNIICKSYFPTLYF